MADVDFTDPVFKALSCKPWTHLGGFRVQHAVRARPEGADTLRYDIPLLF